MQLSNPVTLAKSRRHNGGYVACSAFPGNGIGGENQGRNPREALRQSRRLAVLALVE